MAKGTPINLFGTGVGVVGKSLNVTAAERVNVYYDIQPGQGDKVQVAAYGMPGCELFVTAYDPTRPLRGLYATQAGDRIFAVQQTNFFEVLSDGSFVLRGVMSGSSTQNVEMADSGFELVIAANTNKSWVYNLDTNAFNVIEFDANPGQNPPFESITFQDGYFIGVLVDDTNNTAGFYLSSLYAGTVWSSLDFGVAEFFSDKTIKAVSKNGMLYLFGERSIEVWQNVGDLNFPFQRISGSPSEYGLVRREALAHLGASMIGVFRNRQNDVAVMSIVGYQAQNITPPDLQSRIRNFAAPTDCIAMAYSIAGHDFFQISWATDNESWSYDATVGLWTRMKSGTLGRHIGQWAVPNLNTIDSLVSDYRNGNIYYIRQNVYADNGVTNHRSITGQHVFLPDRGTFRVNSISLDMEHGLVPDGITPQVRLSLSRDGGHTFGEDYTDSSGVGEYARFYQFNRLGRGRDIVPKISMTDPVKFCLLGAVADVAPYGF